MMQRGELAVRTKIFRLYLLFINLMLSIDFILAQGQTHIKSTLFTTGPYMEMLFDGMFVPEERDDGTIVWANPASMYLSFFSIQN